MLPGGHSTGLSSNAPARKRKALRREAQRIGRLRDEYEKWECQLHERTDAWARHRELTRFLDEVSVDTDGQARQFVEWAQTACGYRPAPKLPRGEQPQWTHEERAGWGRPQPKPKYGWQ